MDFWTCQDARDCGKVVPICSPVLDGQFRAGCSRLEAGSSGLSPYDLKSIIYGIWAYMGLYGLDELIKLHYESAALTPQLI